MLPSRGQRAFVVISTSIVCHSFVTTSYSTLVSLEWTAHFLHFRELFLFDSRFPRGQHLYLRLIYHFSSISFTGDHLVCPFRQIGCYSMGFSADFGGTSPSRFMMRIKPRPAFMSVLQGFFTSMLPLICVKLWR